MLARIQRWLTAPVFEEDEDKTRVAGLLNIILLAVLISTAVLTVATYLLGVQLSIVAIAVVAAVSTLVLRIVMLLGYVRLAGILLSFVLLVGTTGTIYLGGTVRSPSITIYVVCLIVAGLLVGNRALIAFTAFSLLAILGLIQAENAGLLPPADISVGITQWITIAVAFGTTAVLLGLASRSVDEALDRARSYAAVLEEQREHLEEMVSERTQALARRARYLEASAEVARDAASELDSQELLSKIVLLISAQFGFYHTSIFLLDEAREYAVLRAASSAGGQRMLARGHRLRVGQEGIVGYVTASGQPRIALDTGEDAVFFDNPDLPETRSELVLPLQARGDLIGALDVQSREPSAFSEEDVSVLQTLANQVALAISNARLFAQTQESLERARRAYGEMSREGWADAIRARSSRGYRYDQHQVTPVEDSASEPDTPQADLPTLALPVQYGDQVLGTIKAHKRAAAGEWAADEVTLMRTLAEQLNVALESARLHEDTQRRAVREQLIGNVTTRMRETLDVDTVLKTAVNEIAGVLGLAALDLRLNVDPGSDPGAAGSSEKR